MCSAIDQPEGRQQEGSTGRPPPRPRKPAIVRIFRSLARQKNRRRAEQSHTAHQINERMMARWTRNVGWLTAALVLVSIVSACIFKWQLDVMQGQLGAMKTADQTTRESFTAVQRPFIIAVSLDVSGQNYGAAATEKPRYLEFQTTLENTGNTPTNNMRVISSVSFD